MALQSYDFFLQHASNQRVICIGKQKICGELLDYLTVIFSVNTWQSIENQCVKWIFCGYLYYFYLFFFFKKIKKIIVIYNIIN